MGSVTIKQGGGTTIVLSRATVANIQAMPRDVNVAATPSAQVIAKSAITTPIARPTNVEVGKMGLQGPKGDPGASGSGQIAPISFSFGDAPHAIFTAPTDGVLSYVRVAVETLFNGVGASMQLGTAVNDGSAMPAAFIDLTTIADYEHTPDLELTAGQSVYVTISPGAGATAGKGTIFLQFLEN